MKTRRLNTGKANPKQWLTVLERINGLLIEHVPDVAKRKAGIKKRMNRRALSVLFEAYADTLGYYVRLNSGSQRMRAEENHIARLWHSVGTALGKIDEQLGEQLKSESRVLKSSDTLWKKPVIQKAWPLLNQIRTNANLANQDDPETQRMMALQKILAGV